MKKLIVTFLCIGALGTSFGQRRQQAAAPEGYQFTPVYEVAATSVKNQYRSGTCWSFAGLAFIESELLRTGKGEYDLSEMWIVRHTYFDKAVRYVRYHGTINFGGGGATHDVTNVIRDYGIVPEEVYGGLNYGRDLHDHMELDAIIEGYVKAVVANKGRTLTEGWQDGLNGILDAYLGKIPESFVYEGVEYTPKSFAASLGLDMNDYISLTSFTHHPFYTQFTIEVPDNWANGLSYNVPLDELIETMEYSIENGYSICWASDVSEKGFAWKQGLAIVPEADTESMDGTELSKWVALTPAEKEAALYAFEKPGREKEITQQMRQKAFDNYETTDDHGMQITGIATDQNGTPYFHVKNSWDTDQVYGGYLYASYPFVQYKTLNIMIHKNAVPQHIREKLGL